MVKVSQDAFFTSVTCRIWGVGADYTVNQNGSIVGGSKSSPRRYTEYWTLIRSVSARGTTSQTKGCPSCGAELKISMGGVCDYCRNHITGGEFGWVLSMIEQDEAYRS